MRSDVNKPNLEIALIVLLIVVFIGIFISDLSVRVSSASGTNVNVTTNLTVGRTFPEIINITIDEFASSVTLLPNSTKIVSCLMILRDYDNNSDFDTVRGFLFNSSLGAADDNNNHYTNNSCQINRTFGSWRGINNDTYNALANCTFSVYYYANPGNWNCTGIVNDTINWNGTNSDNITVNELLAVSLPEYINYGVVNATYVSEEKIANFSNAGNVVINLTLRGWARTPGDNLSMNCSLGAIRNVSIFYEKYNLTASNTGALSLTQFEGVYTNLTSSSPVVKKFDLRVRTDDNNDNAINSTYWRIYLPLGVGGTCEGKIEFGAVKSAES